MPLERQRTTTAAGPARVDRRTKDLIKRARPGEVAVIDHADLDRVAAEGLIRVGVAAVVNAAASFTGRYPNSGPSLIVEAGIPLLDGMGSALLDVVGEGDDLRLVGDELWRDDELLGRGELQDASDLEARLVLARAAIGVELEAFATNTLEYIKKEAQFTFAPLDLPDLHCDFRGRHVLVVVRGHDYRSDLDHLRSYIREFTPVLVAVDGGADALLERGLVPDVIVGDFDSVSESALACGAELVHHVHPDGRAPGAKPSSSGAPRTPSSWPRAPARTSPCSWPPRPAPPSSWPSAPTPAWSSSSTRAEPAWRQPSSPGCA